MILFECLAVFLSECSTEFSASAAHDGSEHEDARNARRRAQRQTFENYGAIESAQARDHDA